MKRLASVVAVILFLAVCAAFCWAACLAVV